MEQQLATEGAAPSAAAAEPQAVPPHQENWAENERMRHIPALEWIIRKLDADLRQRITTLSAPILQLAFDDPRRLAAEQRLQGVCSAIDRLANAAKQGRPASNGPDLPSRMTAAIAQAISALHSLDSTPFGHRTPFCTFERSRAEAVYGALLVVISRVEALVPMAREVDPDVDRKLLTGLVTLTIPDDERMKQPIA